MKRFILVLLIFTLLCGSAYAWPIYDDSYSKSLATNDSGTVVPDTTDPFPLRIHRSGKACYTTLDWAYKVKALSVAAASDDIKGTIRIHLKNLDLLDSNYAWVNAGAGSHWYYYDSIATVDTQDSVWSYYQLHIALPKGDSIKFIWKPSKLNDSLHSWRVDLRLSGNSENITDAIYGRYTNLGLQAAADDTTPPYKISVPRAFSGATYNNLSYWINIITLDGATVDDIDGDLFFEVTRDSVEGGSWYYYTIGGPATYAFNVVDSLCVVKTMQIPGIAGEWWLRILTDGTTDSLVWIDFDWMLSK